MTLSGVSVIPAALIAVLVAAGLSIAIRRARRARASRSAAGRTP